MMTMQEIKEWCYAHVNMKSRLAYNEDYGSKTVFENGDTYEFLYTDLNQLFKPYRIIINGVTAYEGIQKRCM